MNMFRKLTVSAVAVTCAFAIGSAAMAVQQTSRSYPISEEFSGTRLAFTADSALSNFTLTVSGPEGYRGEVYSERVAPSFRLADHGSVPDGMYHWEITAATPERARMASSMPVGADGREGVSGPGFIGTSHSGSFHVVNGRILELDPLAEEQEG